MKSIICQSPVCKLKELNNLFIELTEKNCNQRCKHCYIDFPLNKNIKDFISIDTVKEALNDTKDQDIKCICFTGAEPMTHPEFNTILRMCLKCASVCIFTNGTFINEKKARFLKRVEDESSNEIIFKLGIDHYNEVKNDDIRGRGSYRQVVYAVKSLVKYGFNPILCVTDFYGEDKNILREEFMKLCDKIGFKAGMGNICINEFYDKNKPQNFPENPQWSNLDCETGRILTSKGVYTCPFLANDHRGRCGSSFKDFAKKNVLETNFCTVCIKNETPLFGMDYKSFE